MIIICVPLASLVYTLESWPWGSALCRITECAKDISIGVSVFTLTALSAERYCAIVNPLRKLQVHRNYRLSQYYLLYETSMQAHAQRMSRRFNDKVLLDTSTQIPTTACGSFHHSNINQINDGCDLFSCFKSTRMRSDEKRFFFIIHITIGAA